MKTVILEKLKTTEKIVKQIEVDNILVFVVDRSLRKEEIKNEVENLFGVKVDKVRTYNHKNKKNAYIKLNSKYPAIDIATKLGMI
jgi:large subunit ribosomal protein L23